MTDNPKEKEIIMAKKDIAKLFRMTARRVEQLTEDGILTAIGKPAKYELYRNVGDYVESLREKASGKEKKLSDAENASKKLEGDARFKVAKATIEEMKLKELKGELHRAEDVEAIMTDHVLNVRSELMALPGKLAIDCANLDSAPEVSERIKKEVYEILKTLANYEYDEEKFREKVRLREGWNDNEQESE